MANEPTVSATVKLQYIGRNGDRYVVTRCMEAKQMAKTVTGTFQYNLIYTSRIVNKKKWEPCIPQFLDGFPNF